MRRILIAFFVTLVALSSCRKQEPELDIYDGPVTLYRVGDSFEATSVKMYLLPGLGNDPVWDLTVYFDDGVTENEFYRFSALSNTGPSKKGDVYNPSDVCLFKHLRNLGYSKIESGKIIYMGEEDGKAIVRFEDPTFTITRSDGMGGTFFIRGTAVSEY